MDLDIIVFCCYNFKLGESNRSLKNESRVSSFSQFYEDLNSESLILAQNERWRRA